MLYKCVPMVEADNFRSTAIFCTVAPPASRTNTSNSRSDSLSTGDFAAPSNSESASFWASAEEHGRAPGSLEVTLSDCDLGLVDISFEEFTAARQRPNARDDFARRIAAAL